MCTKHTLTTQEARRIGKFISLVLRHQPEKIGLTLDESGWADVDELLAKLAAKGTRISREQLDDLVETNPKKRYRYSEDGQRIRAQQGHSIEVKLNYEPVQPPDRLYHGTAERFVSSIKQQGLLKRNRHHVHLSGDLDTASQVGKRHGKLVILQVDAARMHEDGYQFFYTPNEVWLTESVPVQYLIFSD
ncbi:MAG: RNA 2'-phosphotransferase [Bacteroidota bacterium]